MALKKADNFPIDEQLLNRGAAGESAVKAGELREAQREEKNESDNSETNEENKSLLEQKISARRTAQITAERKKVAGGVNPLNKATSSLLQKAWINLVSSFGLTLIWINIHVFLGMIFGNKAFCKLGQEWLSLRGSGALAQSEEAKKVAGTAGTFEGAGLACLDLGCLMLIIAVITLISLILDIFTLEGLSRILGWVWDKVANIFSK